MLLHLDFNLIINTDTVRAIEPILAIKNGRERAKIIFTDGTHKIVSRSVEELEWAVGPIIQAPTGYQVIRAFEPDEPGGEITFALYPVLAFRLTADEPVSIIAFGKLGERWALVWPDGRCDEQWNRLWPTVEEFKVSLGSKEARL